MRNLTTLWTLAIVLALGAGQAAGQFVWTKYAGNPVMQSGQGARGGTFRANMISFFAILLGLFFHAFWSQGIILSENALHKKENDILLRRVGKKRVHFNIYDKLFFVVLNRAGDIKHRLRLVKPETLLYWQRTLTKRFWTYEHASATRGRKHVETDVKNLILSMKNDNLLWGLKRIQGELLKLDISLSTKTIRKSFRVSGGEGRSGVH